MICRECAYRRWYWARRDAGRRGVEWLLTFEEWLKIWEDSGHWHERGLKKGQYVMGRYGDKGPYTVGNVRIITNLENTLESNLGRKHTARARLSMGRSHLGHTVSEETRRKIRESNIKTYQNPEIREKASQARQASVRKRLMKSYPINDSQV